MKIVYLMTAILLQDGRTILGDDYEYPGYERKIMSSIEECILKQQRETHIPPVGPKIICKIHWCKEVIYW